MKLNPEQHQAVKHTGSPLVIYAGPGTGKTFILQKKYEHLISSKVKPHKILGITFTRNAARELSERIAENSNITSDRISIMTFHAFCLNIIRRYAVYADLTPGFDIAEPLEQDAIIIQALRANSLPYTPKHVVLLKQSISRIKKKQQNTSPENHIEEYASLIYNKYQTTLKSRNKIDYDDIILKANIALKQPSILSEYSEMFEYILLDEAQDTTVPQSTILYSLDVTNTTIVGDQNQSIYSFAGANPNFMQEFAENTNAEIIYLQHNYRNPQTIINAANNIIQHNDNYIDNILQTHKTSSRRIGVLQTINENSEALLIANAIIHNSLTDVAILYRRNETAKPLEVALQQKVIPYEINGVHFLERKEIQEIIQVIRYILDPSIDHFRAMLINRTGIGKATISKIVDDHKLTEEPLTKCAQKRLTRITKEQHLILTKLFKSIEKVPNQEPHNQIKTIFNEIITTPESNEKRNNLKTFRYLLNNRQESLADTLKYVQATTQSPDVKLMTLHAAKGTESNTVFIVGAEEGLIPDENSFINPKAIEEERRLFYVGLTRARETLILSYAKNRTINGLRLTQTPSRFLSEIPERNFL